MRICDFQTRGGALSFRFANNQNLSRVALFSKAKLARWLSEYPLIFVNVVVLAVGFFFVPALFTQRNLMNLVEQISATGIMAIGLTIVIIAGGIDLSISSNLAISAVVGALVMTGNGDSSVIIGVSITLAVSLLIAGLNALYIVGIGMHHFITTISMYIFLEGVALWITGSSTVAELPWGYLAISRMRLFGWPLPVVMLLLSYSIANFTMTRTVFGRSIYAIGGNRLTAWISGIKVSRIRTATYLISGVCAGIAGILLAGRLGGASPVVGRYLLLDVVSASVLGGASLFGGKGTMTGTLSGVVLIGLMTNLMNLLGMLFYFTLVLKGAILIAAMIFDHYQRNRAVGQKKSLS